MSAWARVNKLGVGEIPQRLFSWLADALPRACRWVADGWQAEPIISHLSTACFSNPARRYTATYEVFRVITDDLLPEYLYLWFLRPEFDRYARFHSWGSARETFNMDDMKRVCIPIPDKSIQQAIVDIYKCAKESKSISSEAEKLRKAVAPALIQKAIHY